MRFLFLDWKLPHLLRDSEYPIGGAAVELQNWLAGLVAAGHQAGVLTAKGAEGAEPIAAPFELLEAIDPKSGVRVARYFYRQVPGLLAAARSFKPDVLIQICAGLDTATMAFIADRLGVPFVYRVANDSDVDERVDAELRAPERLAYRYGLRRAAAILCQNEYQYEKVGRMFPRKLRAILHNPFTLPENPPPVRRRPERKYVAWLGVFRAQKNLPLLASIAAATPHTRFKVAGMPIRRLDEASAAGLATLERLPNVDLVGYVRRDRVIPFLGEAIALLNTSHHEGFSNTFLEAFAAGTPVVAPRAVDPDLIVTRNGLGLTSEGANDLGTSLGGVLALGPLEYWRLAESCRRYIEKHHAPKRLAEQLVELLSPLTGSRAA